MELENVENWYVEGLGEFLSSVRRLKGSGTEVWCSIQIVTYCGACVWWIPIHMGPPVECLTMNVTVYVVFVVWTLLNSANAVSYILNYE
jgi:hypothetical protein